MARKGYKVVPDPEAHGFYVADADTGHRISWTMGRPQADAFKRSRERADEARYGAVIERRRKRVEQ